LVAAVKVASIWSSNMGKNDFPRWGHYLEMSVHWSVYWLALTAGISVILVVGRVGWLCLYYRSIPMTVTYLRGDQLYFRVVSAQPNADAQVMSIRIEIINLTGHAVNIVGGRSDCSCVVTRDLPIEVPADSRSLITLSISRPKPNTGFRHVIVLYLAEQERPIMLLLEGSTGGSAMAITQLKS